MSREDSPARTATMGILGTLFLVGKKTGVDLQSFPIDAERVTIGRDYDCDVRLYFSDVSKLHCEVVFDLLSGQVNPNGGQIANFADHLPQAFLHVHGSNGLHYTPATGSPALHKPPAIIPLSNKDTFMIRKKVFRFEFGATDALATESMLSPAGINTAPLVIPESPVQRPAHRRVSHRLSLVPAGKNFVPMSPMKASRLSDPVTVSAGTTPRRAIGKSALCEEVEEEAELEDADGEGSVVNAVSGEEGDLVYLEMKDGEEVKLTPSQPIHEHAFMTPQSIRKAPLRNTSAVPRTRKLDILPISQVEDQEPTENEPMLPPRTPCSIPLPPSSQTPYESPISRVTPQVVLSTPRGPITLHKALLLRSARKVWEESRSRGVEGAIEAGDVEVRRKSLSPRRNSPNKSSPPTLTAEEVDGAKDDAQTGELQWIYEDGRAEESNLDSDSDVDSFEADMSLDIPGQTVLMFQSPEDLVGEIELPAEDDMLSESDNEDEQVSDDDSVLDDEAEMEEEEREEEDEQMTSEHVVDHPLPGTPAATRMLNKFFTPQPRRNAINQPRRSLAAIGGPPVRFERLPATPSHATGTLIRSTPVPGTLGKPSRRLGIPVQEAVEIEEPEAVQTPLRVEPTPSMRAEAKRRRESLATPRVLPIPPPSGFKLPVREMRLSHLTATPSHPALRLTSPERVQPGVPSTPINDIKHRLSNMRRQSIQRQEGRRATVGFALPATPADRQRFGQSASFTNIGSTSRRFVPQAPATPLVAPPATTNLSVLAQTPISAPVPTVSLHDILPQRIENPYFDPESSPSDEILAEEAIGEEVEYDEITDAAAPPSRFEIPSTPSGHPLRVRTKPNAQAKTPYMAGIRNLYPSTPQPQSSPIFVGVKDLLRVAAVPATPSFTGMKGLFTIRAPPRTPAMDGVKEMYNLQEEECEEEEEVEEAELSAIIVSSPPTSPASKPTARSKSSKPAPTSSSLRRTIPPIGPLTVVEAPVAKAASRRGKRKTAGPAEEVQLEEARSKPSRSRRTAEPVAPASEQEPELKKSTSTSSRARRTTTEEPVTATAPTKSTSTSKTSRSTRTKTVEEPVVVEPTSSRSRSAASRPSRKAAVPTVVEEDLKPKGRGKTVLGDSDDQVTVAPPELSSKPSRGKKAVASTTSDEPKSAPSRRTRTAVVDKENEAVEVEEKKPAKRAVTKKVAEPVAVVTATRATRSKK